MEVDLNARQLLVPLALAASVALFCSACGPRISDRRFEKITFPGGETLWNKSHVEKDDFCLRHCPPDGERISVLYLQLAAGLPRERVGELRSFPGDAPWEHNSSLGNASCCLLESAKPLYFKRSGDVAVLVVGDNIFTRWGPKPPREYPWSRWSVAHDIESTHFLRHFGCDTFAVDSPPRAPPPCRFPEGMPYDQPTLDSGEPVIEIHASRSRARWPVVLIYSTPGGTGWMFDLDRTLRANPACGLSGSRKTSRWRSVIGKSRRARSCRTIKPR